MVVRRYGLALLLCFLTHSLHAHLGYTEAKLVEKYGAVKERRDANNIPGVAYVVEGYIVHFGLVDGVVESVTILHEYKSDGPIPQEKCMPLCKRFAAPSSELWQLLPKKEGFIFFENPNGDFLIYQENVGSVGIQTKKYRQRSRELKQTKNE